jgi:hypothetical protein
MGESLTWEESEGHLFTAQMATGMKAARNWHRLVCGTWEPVAPMRRDEFKWRPHENASTEAGHRDGPEHSSEEASVMEVERRPRVIQLLKRINRQWEESLEKAKPYAISKQAVWEAYKKVKANGGAAGTGIDDITLEEFAQDLKNNLYKLWNRMASGSYFPPAVKAVPIPKKSGGTRLLGLPTVADRIAQMASKEALEPLVEPHFHKDSYGYRPGKSAFDALAETRKRCWRTYFFTMCSIYG